MKITISIKEIIALIFVVTLIKVGLFFYPLLEPHFAESAYVAATGDLDKRTVQEMKTESKTGNNNIYYIGRPSCIDCRETIKNTRILYRICNEKANQRMYYVRLKDEIADSERKYLDSIFVDNIPTIVTFKDEEAIQFKYDDINSKRFEKKFEEWLKNS